MEENQGNISPKLIELSQQCVPSDNKIRLKVRRSSIWEDTVTKIKTTKRRVKWSGKCPVCW